MKVTEKMSCLESIMRCFVKMAPEGASLFGFPGAFPARLNQTPRREERLEALMEAPGPAVQNPCWLMIAEFFCHPIYWRLWRLSWFIMIHYVMGIPINQPAERFDRGRFEHCDLRREHTPCVCRIVGRFGRMNRRWMPLGCLHLSNFFQTRRKQYGKPPEL